MTVGERMREQRMKLDLKPKDIAEKIGKSVSTYYRYETGEIEKLTISKMCEIASLLKVSPIYLLLGLNSDSADSATQSSDLNNCIIMVFSKQLKKLRNAYEMSTSDLCKRLKDHSGISVSEKDIENWENGIQSPEIISLVSIADIFKVSPNYLLGLENYTKFSKPSVKKIREHSARWLKKNIASLISSNSMPRDELAERTGIPLSKIEAYATGDVYSVNPDDVVLIAKAYDIPYLDILYEKDTTGIINKLTYLNAVDIKLLEAYIDDLLSKK